MTHINKCDFNSNVRFPYGLNYLFKNILLDHINRYLFQKISLWVTKEAKLYFLPPSTIMS